MSPEARGGREWTRLDWLSKTLGRGLTRDAFLILSSNILSGGPCPRESIHLRARPDIREGGGHARGIIDEEGEEIRAEGRCRMMDIDDVGMWKKAPTKLHMLMPMKTHWPISHPRLDEIITESHISVEIRMTGTFAAIWKARRGNFPPFSSCLRHARSLTDKR